MGGTSQSAAMGVGIERREARGERGEMGVVVPESKSLDERVLPIPLAEFSLLASRFSLLILRLTLLLGRPFVILMGPFRTNHGRESFHVDLV